MPQTASTDIEAVIARTALKYDLLPYESKPFAASQPARLAALARLFGLETAPLAKARVLELGCASGGNIIPHAVRYPDAQFVGVDLARSQVAAGRARIAALGLKNIEIHCQSFTEIGDDLGAFDYIICHGVYSWVPEVVQGAIFKVVRDRLSPQGVAAISYNVLPGWRMLQPLRDAFMLQVPDGYDSRARVAQARELLNFLKAASPDKGPYGDMLRAWAERLGTLPDDYIAHEFLEECNFPSTVRDFAGSAARAGLGYLGECELSSMILDNYGADIANQVRQRSGNDLVESEQMVDLLSGRTFRQSLLVGQERMANVNRGLSPERLADFHFVLPTGVTVTKEDGNTVLTDPAGRKLTSNHKSAGKALAEMVKRQPASSSLKDILTDKGDDARTAVLDALFKMVLMGMIHLSGEAVACANVAVDKPLASPLSRADAKAGMDYTTNARHETVGLDAVAKVMLAYMDGEHSHKQLGDELLKAAKMAA